MLQLPVEFLRRLRGKIFRMVFERVVWIRSGAQFSYLVESPKSHRPLVAIIGHELFSVVERNYPIKSWWVLRRILTLELKGNPNCLFVIGRYSAGHRKVLIFDCGTFAGDRLSSVVLYIPETMLLRSERSSEIKQVHREGLTYFIDGGGYSHVASGMVLSATAFLVSRGLDTSNVVTVVDGGSIPDALKAGLTGIRTIDLVGLVRASVLDGAGRFGRQAGLAILMLWITYQTLIYSYLNITMSRRADKLLALESQVSEILEIQRRNDQTRERLAVLGKTFNSQALTVVVWRLSVPIRERGGVIYAISYKEGSATIRGQGPSATDILEEIAKISDFNSARLESTSVVGPGKEDFVIVAKVSPLSS
jgi:hypothetical protein